MKNLKRTGSIHAISLAEFKLNEFTTQHGTIIFDGSKGGNISNSLIYNVGHQNFGHIDIYIDKTLKTINSIWFVSLKSEVLFHKPNLTVPKINKFKIPFFDTNIWELATDDLFPRIRNEKSVEVYHNGKDCIHISFGENHVISPINDKIYFQYDKNDSLSGFIIHDTIEVSNLIDLLTQSYNSQ